MHSFEANHVHSKLDLRNQRGLGCCEVILPFSWDDFSMVVPYIISSRSVSKEFYFTFCGFILLSETSGPKSENF